MTTKTDSVGSNCFAADSLPEPEGLAAEFVYSLYSTNETSAPSGGGVVNLTFTIPDAILRTIPISTVDDLSTVLGLDESIQVHTVADLTVSKVSQVTTRDTGILKRAYQSFDRSCKIRSISGNSTDRSLKLAQQLALSSSGVNSSVLQSVAVNYAAQSLSFFSAGQVVESEKFPDADGLPVSALVSDRAAYDILLESERVQFSSNATSLGLLANGSLLERQLADRARGTKISSLETESVFIPLIVFDTFDTSGATDTNSIKRVAFQIERTELLTNGQKLFKTVNISPTATTYTDSDVKYGSRYTYSVKSVYQIDVESALAINESSNTPVNVRVLVASVPSNLATVTTVERVPPPYPVDVSFRFDYQRGELSVRWEFPVNRVQDITRFQVFRRSSPSEPFLLLKELDFDKSEFKVPRPDAPLPVNVSVSDQPFRSYVDRDFGRSSKYIYAVASVDAHGYASNYSAQYEVSFDMRLRSLRVRAVSPAGAPRPYPNIYFDTQQPLIDDTITRGKVSTVNVVFDPEYLQVKDRAGNDLNLIRFLGESAKYYMNVIDTSRAEQISIPVEVADARTT
jgi:hypothetical protein